MQTTHIQAAQILNCCAGLTENDCWQSFVRKHSTGRLIERRRDEISSDALDLANHFQV